MSAPEIEIWVRYRATHKESIEQRHIEFMENMSHIDPPLGFKGLELPPVPECGGDLSAAFNIKKLVKGLKFIGHYKYRGEAYVYSDSGKYDDFIRYGFKVTNKFVDYKKVLHENLPSVIIAYRGYKAFVTYGYHDLHYISGGDNGFDDDGYAIETNEVYNGLRKNKAIEVDGRNNIFTLHIAQYWDDELCQKALGYGPDEVIRRLQGKVTKVEAIMDGVYLILNDNPNITYEEFLELNDKFKPLLGLI